MGGNAKVNKPPFRVMTMKEIEAIPWNGFNVVSTFSGAGGSCLGYRMAGFRVLWASEFVPAAQEVYRANHPTSYLDERDIREVTAQQILDQIGMKRGELDLLDGSPPCASFSISGKREEGWGKVKKYSDTDQRVDDLFFEYVRLVKGLQPKVFVAENVPGLIQGKAKGYFKMILKALKECGYQVKAKELDASWLGVPQARRRLIFMGVRNDLGMQPVFPKPQKFQYTIRDALRDLVLGKVDDAEVYSALLKDGTLSLKLWELTPPGMTLKEAYASLIGGLGFFNYRKCSFDQPASTIMASVASLCHPSEPRRFYIKELRRFSTFPEDFVLTGSYGQQWERIGRAVPPVMMMNLSATIRDEILRRLPCTNSES